MESYWIFLACLPVVAFLYAAVGHGGASGYLALMSLFAFAPEVMRPTALLLNLFVAGIAFYHYWRAGYFNLRLFAVFAFSSIPFSFLGGAMKIDAHMYKVILGILLIVAILKMLNVFGKESEVIKQPNWIIALLVGAGIGFFSGLIGIGGGIILSPVILLFHWGKIKEAAAVSALFIWVNSAAGILGQFTLGVSFGPDSVIFVGLALVGGFLGAYYGSKKMSNGTIRYLLAFVLLLAAVKLIVI